MGCDEAREDHVDDLLTCMEPRRKPAILLQIREKRHKVVLHEGQIERLTQLLLDQQPGFDMGVLVARTREVTFDALAPFLLPELRTDNVKKVARPSSPVKQIRLDGLLGRVPAEDSLHFPFVFVSFLSGEVIQCYEGETCFCFTWALWQDMFASRRNLPDLNEDLFCMA